MKTTTLDMVSMFLAELLGTGIILFFGCMGCLTYGIGGVHLQIALNFGISVMTSCQIFGFVSGAHFNPAVTMAALIYKRISIPIAGIYFVAQMIGGFMGFGLLKLVTPYNIFNPSNSSDGPGLCTYEITYFFRLSRHCCSSLKIYLFISIYTYLGTTMPRSDLTDIQALTIEFVATSILIMVCCAVWDHRNAQFGDSVSLRFGFVIFMLACSVGPLTGGSMVR